MPEAWLRGAVEAVGPVAGEQDDLVGYGRQGGRVYLHEQQDIS